MIYFFTLIFIKMIAKLLTFNNINLFLQVIILKLIIMNFKATINDLPNFRINQRFYGLEICIAVYLMILLKLIEKLFKFFKLV